MATTAQIQAALADAQQNDLSWSEMAALLKRAIINAQVSGSGTVQLPVQAVAADGTSVNTMPIDQAAELVRKWEMIDRGPIAVSYASFDG